MTSSTSSSLPISGTSPMTSLFAGLVTWKTLPDLEETHSLLTNALDLRREGFFRLRVARCVDMVRESERMELDREVDD